MSDDFKVGYGKPPEHSRFTKGKSGNQKGRLKGAKNLKTELEQELKELIDLNEGGVRKRVSKRRAMLKSLMAKAVKGDTKATTVVIDLIYRLLHEDEDLGQGRTLLPEDHAILEVYEKRIRRGLETEANGNGADQSASEEPDDEDDGA